jgi:hypothetical protein
VFQNGAAKQDNLRFIYAEGETGDCGGREKQFEDYLRSLRTNLFQTSLLAQYIAIKGTNKPALVQYLASI